MKYLIAFIGSITMLAFVGLFNTGCVTSTRQVVTNGQTNQVKSVSLDPLAGDAISGILTIGIPYAVKADTNCVPYLRLVSNTFTLAAASGQYDPAAIQAALSHISVKELRSPTVTNLVNTSFNIYKDVFAKATDSKLDELTYGPFAKGLLQAIGDGINAGLPAL